MKMLYLIHEFYPAHHGGAEKFVLQLAQANQSLGHQVKIVSFDNDNRHAATNTPKLDKLYQKFIRLIDAVLRRTGLHTFLYRCLTDKFDPIRYYEESYQNVPVIGFYSRRIAANRLHLRDKNLTNFAQTLLQREAPDIIHAGYLYRNVEFLYVAQQLGIPYIITLTAYWLICPRHILINESNSVCNGPNGGEECKRICPTFAQKQVTARLADVQRLLSQAAAIVAPSHHIAQTFQNEIKTLKLIHIPYGIDCQNLSINTRTYPNQHPLIFLLAGRLVPEKGIHLLLAAFSRLTTRQVKLYIYGDGRLRGVVQQAEREDTRIFYGGVYTNNQVGELLNQVDVVVIPSTWHENLPLIMQEAQACGVPVLVSDAGGMTECVADGVNGFTFRLGDAADLQRKIQRIIDQPEMLNKIKENIRNPKTGQYRVTSLEQEAAMYLEQYKQILAKR